jgi:orotate phosphoribosyltransferase
MMSRAEVYIPGPPDERLRLWEIIREKSFLRGRTYRLASGRMSDIYFRMKSTVLHPEGANLVADEILRRIEGERVDAIGGMVIGAVPIATAVSVKSYPHRPIPAFFVRAEVKGHGTEELIDGYLEKGWHAVVVEDVTTTGGSVMKAIKAVRERGCTVSKVITIVDRLEGAKENLAREGVELVALYTRDDFPE